MVFVVHIAAGVAAILVGILKALGINTIAGQPVTVLGLTTVSATAVLGALATSLGVYVAPLGATAGQKAIAILLNFSTKAATKVPVVARESPPW